MSLKFEIVYTSVHSSMHPFMLSLVCVVSAHYVCVCMCVCVCVCVCNGVPYTVLFVCIQASQACTPST